MSKSFFVSACLFALFGNLASANPTSPYAGQEAREIKALSTEDIEGYLAGKGMKFALVAELNGYPGPSHVLELASELDLTPDQKRRTEALFKSMEVTAISHGRLLVEQERRLDHQFATKAINPKSLATLLKSIGDLQARIRQAHLEAHLAQVTILTPTQVSKYVVLRGYSGGAKRESNHGHKH